MTINSKIIFGIIFIFISLNWVVPSSARSLEEIRRTGTLRICVAPLAHFVDIKPPGCRRDCELSGPSIDLAHRFADRLGKNLGVFLKRENRILPSFESYFFDDRDRTEAEAVYTPRYLKSGECDFYAESLAKRDWRLRKVDIVTYMPGRQMIVVNQKNVQKIKSENDLAGLKTIAEKNTIYFDFVAELNREKFRKNPVNLAVARSGDEKLAALESGRIDFAVIDVGTALQITNPKLSDYKNIYPAFPVGPTSWGGWGFRKDDQPLQLQAEAFFAEQIADKENGINTVFKKYYGVTHSEYLNVLTSVEGPN